jgi:hypothetical protein
LLFASPELVQKQLVEGEALDATSMALPREVDAPKGLNLLDHAYAPADVLREGILDTIAVLRERFANHGAYLDIINTFDLIAPKS